MVRDYGSEEIMRSFIIACVAALVVAIGAAIVLEKYQQTADSAYASKSGART